MPQQDDPFGVPATDHTFIMPTPGQQSPRTPGSQPARPGYAPPPAIDGLIPALSLNPLVAAASPLLNLVPQLLQTTSHPDPAGLRETLARGIRTFEAQARANGVAPEKLIGARYILCTLLDETAASTPWGGSGVWAGQSLLVIFHKEAYGGEKVFHLLAKLAESPAANRDLLELMCIVLALGFEGRYRVIDGGRAQLDQVRERLFQMLRKERGEYERELSPHWQGVEFKRRAFMVVPLWVSLAIMVALGLGLFFALSWNLNRISDPVFAAIQGIHTGAPERVKLVETQPATKPRLSTFLAPEIKAGLVSVADYGDRSVITIRGDGFFKPASATVEDQVHPLLARIGEALNSVPGTILITGHTDKQPIHSARFPSNWHLSQERATAVEQMLATSVQAGRMRIEGRADAEPVAANDTPEGRARNRRVEITLFVAKPGA
jgi:type VI secretion system protein ImpK